jgi:hypothetical protein
LNYDWLFAHHVYFYRTYVWTWKKLSKPAVWKWQQAKWQTSSAIKTKKKIN